MKTNRIVRSASAIIFAAAILLSSAVAASDPTVYIAPNQGKKYHDSSKCRGLNKARSIKSYKLSKLSKSYTACKICRPQKR